MDYQSHLGGAFGCVQHDGGEVTMLRRATNVGMLPGKAARSLHL
jgi:hypothetical protein